ncbi:alanyl-tRNA editing protein [Microvirga tunisiensis]|uniref:Alanine--tRNA ligase n=2 Tax=Pannonibacter tanglangensis TaxID=2750084 RepID=A0A7X5F1P8_9HYPH|nr:MULTISPECIES: alanyl-tRNA editing protein [unclassified Pannonibacter]NBN62417.1 alanyl-tRNA editing protein [Pannonibacter sp. XCT-34]NBN78073.1 alanyl-tRNA editing protein [Pannonibacter sp. XCT-53]
MTEPLFRDDAYLRSCEARVVDVTADGAIVLDRTVFYATSGGQPGDTGYLERSDGSQIPIAAAIYADGKDGHRHLVAAGAPMPAVGDLVVAHLDWARRYRLMRMHTALHIICAVLKTKITGCQIGADESRIDLDMPEPPEREAIEAEIRAAVARDMALSTDWITDAELDANPGLIKSMSVSPPRGSGRVRLVRIGEDFDLQPCGGTHVSRTTEVGRVDITRIEKKGKLNRRIRIQLAD